MSNLERKSQSMSGWKQEGRGVLLTTIASILFHSQEEAMLNLGNVHTVPHSIVGIHT
jgi:hypothetical protein